MELDNGQRLEEFGGVCRQNLYCHEQNIKGDGHEGSEEEESLKGIGCEMLNVVV